MTDREQKGGIVRFLRRLLQRPLPNAKPTEHPSVFIYDLRAEFSPMASPALSYHTYEALNTAAYKGEAGAKEAGKMRAEGKEYVVKDGDVMNFLFNV